MFKLTVYDLNKNELEKIDLHEAWDQVQLRPDIVHFVLRALSLNKRNAHPKVKNRSEVAGGTRKPYRQKGTGYARQGTIRAPHYRGGGVVFGPNGRIFNLKINKKVKRLALLSVLKNKLLNDKVILVDKLSFENKTKKAVEFLRKFDLNKAFILGKFRELAFRNLDAFKYLLKEGLNIYDLLKYENFVTTKDIWLNFIEGRYLV